MNTLFTLCAFADEADASLERQIDALRENGIPMLEIRGVNGVNISGLTEAQAHSARERLDQAGVRVWALGSPIGKIRIQDPFAPHLDSFHHLLELGRILGASRLRLFSFYGCDGSAAARDEVLLRLSRLAEAGEGSGLVLCHENEKDIYGEKAPECLDVHRSIPALKAVFDPANFVQAGQDTLQAWDLLAPYVDYMHIKDATRGGEVVPAGMGAGNIPALLERYAAAGGQVLTLEPHLSVFAGLGELEQGSGPERAFTYATQREAFDAGVRALRELL